jgi:hypothetical protein
MTQLPVNSRFTVTFAHRNSRSHRSLVRWPIRNAAEPLLQLCFSFWE